MMNEDKTPDNTQGAHNDERFIDEQTDLKIRQHLSDINDVISDQDIQNVRTDFDEESLELLKKTDTQMDSGNFSDADEEMETEEKKEPGDKEDGYPIATPWNILGS